MGFRIQEVTVGITAQISIKNNGLAITHSFYVDSTKKIVIIANGLQNFVKTW